MTFSSTTTLLVGALMGAVAVILVVAGYALRTGSRVRKFGPLRVIRDFAGSGYVVVGFATRKIEDSERRATIEREIGRDQFVMWSMLPDAAIGFARSVEVAAIETKKRLDAEREEPIDLPADCVNGGIGEQ